MREDTSGPRKQLGWGKRVLIAAGIFCILLIIVHRPLLLSVGHWAVTHYASSQHLKANFRLEGNPFGDLTVRNLHLTPVGPSDIESVDADYARLDYDLIGFLGHGMSRFLNSVELHSARIVMNPAKTTPSPAGKKGSFSLPTIFPDKLQLRDVTLIVRDKPHDLVIDNLDLDLEPEGTHPLQIDRVQLQQGQDWSGISAQTSYQNRNLVIQNLQLGNDQVRRINIDASKIGQNQLEAQFDARIGGGAVEGAIALAQQKSAVHVEVHLLAKGVDAADLNKYAALPADYVHGQIEQLRIDGAGLLHVPKSWSGEVAAQLNDFGVQENRFDRINLDVVARDSRAQLQAAEIVQGPNQIQITGFTELPADPNGFLRAPARFKVTGEMQDMERLTSGMSQSLTGSAHLDATLESKDGVLIGQAGLSSARIGFGDGTIDNLSGTIQFSKKFKDLPDKRPWYADLTSEGRFQTGAVHFKNNTIDSMEASFASKGDQLTLDPVTVASGQDRFSVHGQYQLPADFSQINEQPASLNISASAPNLGALWVSGAADQVTGALEMSGQLRWNGKTADGQLSLNGTDIKTRDLLIQKISGQLTVDNNIVYLNDFTATVNQQDFVQASGKVDLHAPYPYSVELTANLPNLSALEPVLNASGNQKKLAGSLMVRWKGSGQAKTFKNSGQLKLTLDRGRYGDLQSLEAKIDASYSPDGFNIPIIYFSSDKMELQATAQARGDRLEISKIQVYQGKARYADGYISIPFVWGNLGSSAPVFPTNGKVTANFQSQNLDLDKLFKDLGMTPAASGTLNIDFNAGGTLANLDARLNVQGQALRAVDLKDFEPATFNLVARVNNGQLTMDGKLEQARIQPLQFKANLPFPLPTILREGKIPDSTPVNATVQLPRSSVNFVRQFVPGLDQVDGDIVLDVKVGGTIGQPVLSGTGDVNINVVRFSDPTIPSLQGFKARLVFNRDTLSMEQFRGDLAGGPFTVSGKVTFPRLTQPRVDLQFKASSALIARNDTLTVRADADISVNGPLNSALVKGKVGLTNSHFLKNLDLLPIGLPGRPAPEPPLSRPEFSFPQPPLRNWKFDIDIETKNPFSIKGSLASGSALVKLHLGGTGLHPALEGQVRLRNVEATLPFSRLNVDYGFLYFDPSDPLNPKIDLHGTSVIRDYTIHVYVYGRSLSPEAIFSSEPPLPQEEIISLLATGATREELTGNNNVLAGRAAMLLFQQLYRKVFKKGESTQSNSVFDRLELDVGQIDPRTGQQMATARFKVTHQVILIGDIAVGGDFRGLVKYLIRFR